MQIKYNPWKILVIPFLCFIANSAYCQALSGKVIDIDGIPIEYAHVFVKNTNQGTLTNSDGSFRLDSINPTNDTLIISFLGYNTFEIKYPYDSSMVVALKKQSIFLEPISITSLSPKEIVSKAFNAIPDNFHCENISQEGFYREQLYNNDTLYSLSEAIVSFNAPSKYEQPDLIIKKKQSIKFHSSSASIVNGPLVLLERNETYKKNSIFSNYFIKQAAFKLSSAEYLSGQLVYKIHFQHVEKSMSGTFWINGNNFGILYVNANILTKNSTNALDIYYQEYDHQYVLSAYKLKKQKFNRKKQTSKGIVEFINTKYLQINTHPPTKKNNSIFLNNDALIKYEDNYDPLFWDGHRVLLPDSVMTSQLRRNIKPDKIRKKKSTTKQDLYFPHLDFVFSSQKFNDVNSLNHNINSLSRLTNYFVSSNIKNKQLASGIQSVLSPVFISFQKAEAQRRLLKANGIQSVPNYFPFNPYSRSLIRNVTNTTLADLKDNQLNTFQRVLLLGFESNYNSIKTIEENTLRFPFLEDEHLSDQFISYYLVDIVSRRLALVAPYILTKQDKFNGSTNELNLPFVENNLATYAHYLFNPNAELNRSIRSSDLEASELMHLNSLKFKSLLNLVPIFTSLLPVSLGNGYALTISGGYIPTYFGDQYEEIFYMRKNNSLFQFNIKQFLAKNTIGLGGGIKFSQSDLFKNLSFITAIDYWEQPISFLGSDLVSGFAISQSFYWKRKSYSLWVQMNLKTLGFHDSSNFTTQDQKIVLGTRINLK